MFHPWTFLRMDSILGGRLFGSIIIYKFLLNSVVFVLASGQFSTVSAVEMAVDDARIIY